MAKIVFERMYDNPKNEDGTDKPNKLIGEFEVVEWLHEDMYESQFIGLMDDEIYLVTETEVSGYSQPELGGSRFSIKKLTALKAK